MTEFQHQNLAAGRWQEISFFEQMGNLGSEVNRALRWREKGNEAYAQAAVDRLLELFELSIADPQNSVGGRRKELTRARECWLDFFLGENQYGFTAEWWRNYFDMFAIAARKSL